MLAGSALGGFGYALSDVAMTILATSAAPDDLRGAAAGLLNTSVQVGAALGVGLAGALVNELTAAGEGLLAGLRAANLLGLAFAVAATAVLLFLLRATRRSDRSADGADR